VENAPQFRLAAISSLESGQKVSEMALFCRFPTQKRGMEGPKEGTDAKPPAEVVL
jgi:hypothetical protein